MTISRLFILLAALGGGLSSIYYVPRNDKIQPSRITMELPERIRDWEGRDAEVTEKERNVLAADTQFARKVYENTFGDSVFVSIVLSGQDLDNSIHRPERCLPAQGWTLLDSKKFTVPVPSAAGGALPVTRLHNSQNVRMEDGRIVTIYNLSYYWFVGNSRITASHLDREFTDMKDRLLYGFVQHWAYITVSARITEGLVQFGRSEQETDRILQQMIRDLYPKLVKDRPAGAG